MAVYRCENCGGEYETSQIVCPYCGYESVIGAKKEQTQEIERVQQQIREEKKKPERIVHKATWYIVRIAIGVVALFLCIWLIVWLCSIRQASGRLGQQEKQIAKLEQYYVAGDYQGMDEYLDSLSDTYSVTYEKYETIAWINNAYLLAKDACESDWDFFPKVTPGTIDAEELAVDLGYAMSALERIKEQEEKGFLYGEREAALQIRAELYAVLEDTFFLTEEEIDSCVTLYCESRARDEKADLTEYGQMIYDRLEKYWEDNA